MDWHKFDKYFLPVAEVFSPSRCVLCEKLMEDISLDICPQCRIAAAVFAHHPWKIPHVKQWKTLWLYRGDVRSALIRLKFLRRPSYGTIFGRELGQKLKKEPFPVDVITWVPISFWRMRKRSYDQVELIAREAAWQLELPVQKLLHKIRHNRRQASIRGKKARIANVKGVYRAMDPEAIRGKRILLIDDIITTGATVSEAARVLREAGAASVYVACVASASDPTFRPD